MKVAELIQELSRLPQDAEVVLSKDAEGNAFSPFAGEFSFGVYVPETTWSGEFYNSDDEMVPEGQKAIVLWPTN